MRIIYNSTGSSEPPPPPPAVRQFFSPLQTRGRIQAEKTYPCPFQCVYIFLSNRLGLEVTRTKTSRSRKPPRPFIPFHSPHPANPLSAAVAKLYLVAVLKPPFDDAHYTDPLDART